MSDAVPNLAEGISLGAKIPKDDWAWEDIALMPARMSRIIRR